MDFYEVVNNNGHCTPTRRKIPLLRKRKHFDEKINSRCASVRGILPRRWRGGAVNACPINNYLFLIVAPVSVFINLYYVNNKCRRSA